MRRPSLRRAAARRIRTLPKGLDKGGFTMINFNGKPLRPGKFPIQGITYVRGDRAAQSLEKKGKK